MTCNPNWPEIKENLRRGQKASDRPDIVARVFMQKLKELNKDLDEGVLGIQAARVHVVEYQKRGLPHAHILLILRPEDKPVSAEDVDNLVCVDNLVWVELPDKDKYPELYETVISSMMHGPCGKQNPRSPCMKNVSETIFGRATMSEDKYAAYRRPRRPHEFFSHKGNVWNNATVNQWVVPFNPFLSQKYNWHVNVEICATNKAIKCIYKYVYKDSDMTTITIDGAEMEPNKIRKYLLGRYISPVEACNRVFMYPIQGSTDSVVNLPIHLEDMNMVAYRGLTSTTQIYNVIHRGSRSKLTEVLGYAPNILMQPRDVPTKYRWDNKKWKPYKKYVPSRIVHVSPQDPDRFYLRLLICHRRSPKSYEDLRRVKDDQEWSPCLTEAAAEKIPYHLRQLFAIVLVYSLPTRADKLWEEFKAQMSEGFVRNIEEKDTAENIHREGEVRARMAEYKALKFLAHYLASNGKTLEVYGLSELRAYSDVSAKVDRPATESIVRQELNAYSQTDLEHVTERVDQLNRNQRDVFDQVVRAVEHPVGGEKLFSSTSRVELGNPFFWSKYLRMFDLSAKWPLRQKAERIRNASFIIWDEAPIMNCGCFEAVDRTFRDIMKNESEPFGGKVIVFSGDHRQILPVLKDATRAETIAACFKNPGSAADLAEFSEFLLQIGEGRYPVNEDIGEGDICLPHDMCVFPEPLDVLLILNEPGDEDADSDSNEDDETEPFPNFKLLPSVDDHNSRDLDLMVHDAAPDSDNVPPEVGDADDDRRRRNVNALIDAMHPGINADDLPNEYFVEQAILAPTNASVRRINEIVAARLTGETKEYLPTDSLEGVADRNLFEQEFLNSLNFSGIPPHKIVLKVGTPIIMIRNLNSDAGLCMELGFVLFHCAREVLKLQSCLGLPRETLCLILESYSTPRRR
ncbi:Helitron helicase [Phytophthora megakarya]|uniref:ATP-dependent DNA helicase n=1 Tax=Phytophthora megakarya TaxID=4795 RepID=A0A225W1T3_9STRA|nr:Helitron helicase [Phytophthora megakarya]